MPPYVLYGMPASLYTAKARSYLRKRGIGHEERAAGDPRFAGEVVPRIGRFIMPVLETPDGDLVQDTVDIIDHLEQALPPERSVYPADVVLRCLAHLLELFGASLLPGGAPAERAQVFAAARERLLKATAAFGVNDQTAAGIEASYAEFLSLLDAHLAGAPYLLGGRPTVADYGFIGPLYAHLARDPCPSLLMKQSAGRVWRWAERMNAPVADTGEYPGQGEELFAAGAVPETLLALLDYIGREVVPELVAQVAFIDAWLIDHPEAGEGEVVGGAPHRRSLGFADINLHGQEVSISVLPYRLLMLQRLQAAFAGGSESERTTVESLFAAHGLESLLRTRPRRRVERRENREVWGAEQAPRLP